jgi:hypothetical protein
MYYNVTSQWESNKYTYLCVCVSVCVRVPERVVMCMRVRACSLAYPA